MIVTAVLCALVLCCDCCITCTCGVLCVLQWPCSKSRPCLPLHTQHTARPRGGGLKQQLALQHSRLHCSTAWVVGMDVGGFHACLWYGVCVHACHAFVSSGWQLDTHSILQGRRQGSHVGACIASTALKNKRGDGGVSCLLAACCVCVCVHACVPWLFGTTAAYKLHAASGGGGWCVWGKCDGGLCVVPYSRHAVCVLFSKMNSLNGRFTCPVGVGQV